MPYHLIHPSLHKDRASLTGELAAITSFVSCAVEGEGWAGDADARTGAMLILSAVATSLAELSDAISADQVAAAQARNLTPTATTRPDSGAHTAPDLTEPAPPAAKRQKRAG